jgi:uncharacterized Zn-binding protein involved in type VI secretion
MKTTVNPPRTPVTKGSKGVALATMPNVCKMPGPPAPFVPAPLPNLGQSSDGLKGATKKVKIEKKVVAIKGASFKSKGDMPSKGTGGGLMSTSTHGATKFVAPGSMDVKAEGKNIHLLGDATTNNNSNPANAATIKELQMAQGPAIEDALKKIAEDCNKKVNEKANADNGRPKKHKPSGKECTALGTKKHKCCEDSIKQANNPQVKSEVPYGKRGGLLSNRQQSAAFSRANQAYNTAKAAQVAAGVTGSALTAALKGVWAAAFFGGGPGAPALKADVVILNPPATKPLKKNINRVLDFKFNCGDKGKMSSDQQKKYKKLLGKVPKIIHASW